MKIAVISPNPGHLAMIGKMLEPSLHRHSLFEGGKTRLREVVERETPDIAIVDGMCCDSTELAHVEYVTTHFPGVSVILMCANSSSEFLLSSMRAGVREVIPSPATPAAISAAIERVSNVRRARTPQSAGKVLAFISAKGGCGATFLATNLSVLISETRSVLLIDLNLQFGDALSFVHDDRPASTIADIAREINRLDASFLAASAVRISPNLNVLAAPEDPSQAMEIKPEHVDALLALAAAHYDYVILDVRRELDTIAVKALDRAHQIFPVLQAGLPFLRSTKKLLNVFRSLGYAPEKIALVVNRFERSGEIGIAEIERSLSKPVGHTIPNSYRPVNASINHGSPLITSSRTNPVSRTLAEFAKALNPQKAEQRGLFDRLLNRSAA